jgi:hypothetical protein
MHISNCTAHAMLLVLIGIFAMSSVPAKAISLRDARELAKRHRFVVLAITSAAVVYLYSHKLIEKAIYDYYHPDEKEQKEHRKTAQDTLESSADIFIKSTKLVGTIYKVFRALTCPDEGKIAGDQWLDDFSQMA